MLEVNKEWHNREWHIEIGGVLHQDVSYLIGAADDNYVVFRYRIGDKNINVKVRDYNVIDFYDGDVDFYSVAERFYQEHVAKIRKCVMDTYFPDGISYDSIPDVVTIYLHPSLGGYALDAHQGSAINDEKNVP